MMSDSARTIHLLLERLDKSYLSDHPDNSPVQPRDTTQPASPERLEIRDGVNYLAVPPGKPPSLVRRMPVACRNLLILQPVWHYPSPKLLMLVPGSMAVNVNGAPAPPVSLLDEKDEVSFNRSGRFLIHVTIFHNPQIGPPLEHEVGTRCPVCRVKFTEETTVYRCHNCSRALHIENEDRPKVERLECAAICTECPACRAGIQMNAGYRYLPEFCSQLNMEHG